MPFWIFLLAVWIFTEWMMRRSDRRKNDRRFANVVNILNNAEKDFQELKRLTSRVAALEKEIASLKQSREQGVPVDVPAPTHWRTVENRNREKAGAAHAGRRANRSACAGASASSDARSTRVRDPFTGASAPNVADSQAAGLSSSPAANGFAGTIPVANRPIGIERSPASRCLAETRDA